ncbi:Dissimilatory sulphite reductase D domain protein [Candidatus Omnitrophus magneticus]|uniref:Dissimilatory sulphite reductase D domain protein n=1 Tax=Candidatus Omnitrophus magneticus TaxID=1609969 RepID=A0A0F0CSW3_9BACT|nr:Dissimilatory sulphite reductase D domain protein [Candidatus Omnitrophus magneticus]
MGRNEKGYFKDFQDIFTELKSMDISNLLRELKNEGKIVYKGSRNAGYWQLAKA